MQDLCDIWSTTHKRLRSTTCQELLQIVTENKEHVAVHGAKEAKNQMQKHLQTENKHMTGLLLILDQRNAN